MTQTSFPKGKASEKPLDEDQWKNLFLAMGRGIVDMGGFPYSMTRDSVTDTVTIGVDSIHGYNVALLDGFMHYMDAPEQVSVPPVATETVYEIGLVFDFENVNTEAGPITLAAWPAPGDLSGGKSRLALWQITRKPNVALGSSAYVAIRPRCAPVIVVGREVDKPTSSLILSDTLCVVRDTGKMYRAGVSTGTVQWYPVGTHELLETATHLNTPNTLVKRWSSGTFHVPTPLASFDVANKGYVDDWIQWVADNFDNTGHTHNASDILLGTFSNDLVKGSTRAYTRNPGSTYRTVVANSNGDFGYYPSAAKYKVNTREWRLDPKAVIGVVPIKYEDKEYGDTRIGVLADSYVATIPELVHFDEDGSVGGWNYMLFGVAQQVALRDLDKRVTDQATTIKAQAEEIKLLRDNQAAILAHLGLTTDAAGRVITTDSGSEA